MVSVVFATAPSITDLSPDNNSINFENVSLIATAIDVEGDPINYTFYVEPSIYMDNGNWTMACDNDPGDEIQGVSLGNPNYCFDYTHNPGESSGGEREIVINTDEFRIAWKHEKQDDVHNARVYIDGTQIHSEGVSHGEGSGTWRYPLLDVLDYNDDSNHTISVECVRTQGTGAKWCSIWWWFPQYTNETETNEEADFIVQNGSTNNYTLLAGLYDIGANSYLYPKKWWVTAYDNNSESNTSNSRNIDIIQFINCSEDNIALNFTIQDEETDNLLISELDADFTLSNDDVTEGYNFELSGNNTYQFCLSPTGVDVTLSGFVNYIPEDNENYSYARSYYFNDASINGNNQQDITLYALEDTYATEITFTVQEDGNNLEGATIYAERYDIGTGNYLLVAMGKTSASGQTTMYLRYGDAYYKFLIYDEDGNLRKTEGVSLLSTTSKTFYLFSSVVEDDYLETWIDLQKIIYSFSYNNVTNVSSLSYSSPAGTPLTQGCLRVTEIDFGGEDEVCYSCESSASATINCLLTDLDADYRNEFIAYVNNTYYIMDSSYLSLTESLSDKIGLDGVFIAIFIIGLLAFVGLFNPASAIIFAILGVILVSMFGLIDLGLTAIVAIIFVGVVLAFKLKT